LDFECGVFGFALGFGASFAAEVVCFLAWDDVCSIHFSIPNLLYIASYVLMYSLKCFADQNTQNHKALLLIERQNQVGQLYFTN
jgi:hypothetical protein